MKKFFTMSMALVLATGFYTEAQNFEPARERELLQKPFVERPIVGKPTVKRITEDWWEPDTVIIYKRDTDAYGEIHRRIYSYNEKGVLETMILQK